MENPYHLAKQRLRELEEKMKVELAAGRDTEILRQEYEKAGADFFIAFREHEPKERREPKNKLYF